MFPIRDNSARAKTVITLTCVYMVCFLLQIIAHLYKYSLISGYDGTNDAAIRTANMIIYILIYIDMAVSLAFIILFICWFRRAYYNLHVVNPYAASVSEGWAAGAWFVPFYNLVKPYQIMREIWVGTLVVLNGMNSNITFPRNMLRFWWLSYISYNVISSIGGYVTRHAYNYGEISNGVIIYAVAYAVGFVSLLLLLLTVVKFSVVERQLKIANESTDDSVFSLQNLVEKENSSTSGIS